jgi:hypothetical protein
MISSGIFSRCRLGYTLVEALLHYPKSSGLAGFSHCILSREYYVILT